MAAQADKQLFPSYPKIEAALLQLISSRGGQIKSAEAYEPLADYFNLTSRARTIPRGEYFKNKDRSERAWNTLVQWGRRDLKKAGYIAPSKTGIWKLSAEGIEHAARSGAVESAPATPVPARVTIGTSYRQAEENHDSSQREPFEVDPNVIDRGNNEHSRTQNALAEFLTSHRLEPLSPKGSVPDYDLGWKMLDVVYVAEVKSITNTNEERQLRLGLGQVLRYRHQMAALGVKVCAVLVPEREPVDRSWHELCESLGVLLAWPGAFNRLIPIRWAQEDVV